MRVRKNFTIFVIMVWGVLISACADVSGVKMQSEALEIEGIYAQRASLENGYAAKVFVDATGDQVDDHYLTGVGYVSEKFWNLFQLYQTHYGKNKSVRLLQKIVDDYGLCMIARSNAGPATMGPAAFDEIVEKPTVKQTRFYRVAAQKKYFSSIGFLPPKK